VTGRGFGLENALLALAIALGVGLFLRRSWHLYRLMRLGGPERRLDRPRERWWGVLTHVLGQGRLLSEPYSGLMHAMLFWGFLVVTVMTADMLLTGVVPGLSIPWVEQSPLFLVTLETFQALVLAGLAMAFFRRLVSRPRRLNYTWDALLILSLITALMLTAFLATSTQIALEARPWDRWSYVSSALAPLWGGLGPGELRGLNRAAWWLHVLTVLGFLSYLPWSKHLHIVTSAPNVWLRSTRPKGELPYLDVEAKLEVGEPLGAGDVTDLTWKDHLDAYTCTECGRCEAECPASRTGKPLSPKWVILDLKHYLLERGPALLPADARRLPGADAAAAAAERPPGRRMVGDAVTDPVLWDCTTCRACMEACPVFIEHVPKIVDMRRYLVMTENRFEPDARRLFENLEASGNPWRFPRATRGDWARELDVPVLGQNGLTVDDVDYLLWVGCAGAHDERYQKVMRTLVGLLRRAGQRFAILGRPETCTGDPARRAGHEYLYQLLARENVATLNELGVKRIVASCPHCFNTLKAEYPQLGGHYEVIHHTVLLARLLAEGKLPLRGPHPSPLPEGEGTPSIPLRVPGALWAGRGEGAPPRGYPAGEGPLTITYHDPCYIGRYHDLYEQPRDLLRAVGRLREMPGGCHHNRAMCCGAGGARAFMEEKRGSRINHLRLLQAMAAEPGAIATACPYCIMMLEDAARTKGLYDQVPVRDVGELLADALE
jgi:Fe-S oxidoreductase/nitrate reductase gamma subunit